MDLRKDKRGRFETAERREVSWIVRKDFHFWAMLCFVVLSLLGVVLRLVHVFSLPALNYLFLLHAHSHFAFAGWMFLAITILMTAFSEDKKEQKRFGRIFILTLISAFGMLFSFSVQGYKPVSISFSTLFIIVTYLFSWHFLQSKQLKQNFNIYSLPLLKAALAFLCLSSLGPLALGPLMVLGYKGTVLYQNSIYFYLHFQLNGWMLLATLGLLANTCLEELKDGSGNLRRQLKLFAWSTIPAYLIFTLWSRPALPVYLLSFLATGLNLGSWIAIVIRSKKLRISFLARIAVTALSLKLIFQVLICVPVIGNWVFGERNLIVGYIHLLTLAVIMPLILDLFFKYKFFKPGTAIIVVNRIFVLSVATYLFLLFIQPLLLLFKIQIPYYQHLLLVISGILALIGVKYLMRMQRRDASIESSYPKNFQFSGSDQSL